MTADIKQLKLTNNDEIICEIVQYADDENIDIVVRKCMKIITVDDYGNSIRYYTFKPWITFQDDLDDLSVLNSVHVISETKPSATVLHHYAAALIETDKINKLKTSGVDISSLADDLSELTEEEMDAFINAKLESLNENTFDSNEANVIQFKPKTTMH
jgi:replicative DNA helicase